MTLVITYHIDVMPVKMINGAAGWQHNTRQQHTLMKTCWYAPPSYHARRGQYVTTTPRGLFNEDHDTGAIWRYIRTVESRYCRNR